MFKREGNARGMAPFFSPRAPLGALDAVIKLLSVDMPPMQIAALRGLVTLPLLGIYMWRRHSFHSIVKIKWPLQMARGVLAIAMLWSFSVGIKSLAMTQAYTIFFISPMLIAILAWPLLGERPSHVRWVALIVGLTGILIALRPSTEGMVSLGGLAVLVAATCYATSAVISRRLSRTDSTDSQVFWVMAFLSIGGTALALPQWQALSVSQWQLMPALALSGFIGQLAITDAFKHGRAATVASFEYSALAWAVSLDLLIWGVLPDALTFVGAGVVIATGLWLLRVDRH